ncbi:MAG: periplasmic heavy metal sensor [Myxococcales bacterium FL481]|nr:MAG: periplasmic heavy metal sensor [Myxococcales bacterium FL481]
MARLALSPTLKTLGALAFATTITAGAVFVPGSADAQATAAAPERGQGRHASVHKLCAALECTPEQKQQLSAIKREVRQTTKAERRALKADRQALAAAFRSDALDRQQVDQLFASMQLHRDNLSEAVEQGLVDTHAVLTPKQREMLAQRLERRGPNAALSGGKRPGGQKAQARRHRGGNPKGHKRSHRERE